MVTRRESYARGAFCACAARLRGTRERDLVNDVHSQLNRTRIRELLRPPPEMSLVEIVRSASRKGCRYLFRLSSFDGAQQFATDSLCIDTRSLDRVISFDQESGLIEAESRHPMAEINSHLSGCPRAQGKAMGHSSKTNRRRHIHAGWKSLIERARARTGDEAADFKHRILHV